MKTIDHVDYAVIVALDEEADYFRNIVNCDEAFDSQGFTCHLITDADWKPYGVGVLIVSGGMGTSRAKKTAQLAVDHFKAKFIANVGIAGRVDENLSLGDVIVPGTTFDVTQGGKVGGEKGGPPKWTFAPVERTVPGRISQVARTILRQSRSGLAMNLLNQRFAQSGLLPKRGIQIHARPLACVPEVGANDDYRQSLLNVNRTIAGMEMESAGILEVAHDSQIDTIIVRGLSDGADFNKRELEKVHKDENRRLAMEAAVIVLDAAFQLSLGQDAVPDGVTLARYESLEGAAAEKATKALERHDAVFSLLVYTRLGEAVDNPIREMARMLRDTPSGSAIFLLGEKGSGKTKLFQHLQVALMATDSEAEDMRASLNVRMSKLETYSNGRLDSARTDRHVASAVKWIKRIAEETDGSLYVLIDGLNQTGPARSRSVSRLIGDLMVVPNVRFAISAQTDRDVENIHASTSIPIRETRRLVPMDIEDPRLPDFVNRFANVANNEAGGTDIIEQMRIKQVRAVDVFLLKLFFERFSTYPYNSKNNTLANCYELYCKSLLPRNANRSAEEQTKVLSEIAAVAFDIAISETRSLNDVEEEHVARLIANHSSITNYLVATHVVDTILKVKGRANIQTNRLNAKLRYVFPAEVNSFTKQMMYSDRELEEKIVELVKLPAGAVHVLVRSHLAYLAGRVTERNKQDVRKHLQQISQDFYGPTPEISNDARMQRRTVFISRSMLGDQQGELDYVNILLKDTDEAEFNRGFHLQYYGDVPFVPKEKMFAPDSGDSPCNRSFSRLVDRIRRGDQKIPLIELVTLLSLVQIRHARRTLPNQQRLLTIELLESAPLTTRKDTLPPNVRGYVNRMREDLKQERFSLATVLQEWLALPATERTGWLRRRRDAGQEREAFWKDRRIESVAEHTFSAMSLAATFLNSAPKDGDRYDKVRIMHMLLIHDLAESHVGDRLGPNDQVEMEVLWQYGAFATYKGVGDLWWIPELFDEFSKGQSVDARIARDFDYLQFILQGRLLKSGMTSDEHAKCEEAKRKITSQTVRGILELLEDFPQNARFAQQAVTY